MLAEDVSFLPLAFEKLSTGLRPFDEFFDGGLSKGQHIEIHGHPGTGKTVLCMQIAMNLLKRDVSSKILWIDTNGTFPTHRLAQLCHFDRQLMERFMVIRARTVEELFGVIKTGPPFPMELLVIDNICMPFRVLKAEGVAERVDVIRTICLWLRRWNPDYHTVCLYVNHLTTKFLGPEKSIWIPALGENWSVFCDMRLRLEKKTPDYNTITVVRSDYETHPPRELMFSINDDGVHFTF